MNETYTLVSLFTRTPGSHTYQPSYQLAESCTLGKGVSVFSRCGGAGIAWLWVRFCTGHLHVLSYGAMVERGERAAHGGGHERRRGAAAVSSSRRSTPGSHRPRTAQIERAWTTSSAPFVPAKGGNGSAHTRPY